jgi:hypothetical protein
MPRADVFTMKLDAELRAKFMAEANASDRPASQVVRESDQWHQGQREHDAFLHRKVEVARVSVDLELGRSNAAVEARFAVRRARIADQA